MALFRRSRRDDSLKTEAFVLTGRAIAQSLGVKLSDAQVAIGFALCDEADGHRVRRARRAVSVLAKPLTQRDRSLAAALPVFWYDLSCVGVHVISADDQHAQADVELYLAINEHMGRDLGIGLLHADQSDAGRAAAYAENITVGALEQFKLDRPSGDAAVLRVASNVDGYRYLMQLPE